MVYKKINALLCRLVVGSVKLSNRVFSVWDWRTTHTTNLTRSAWQGVSCTGATCAMYTTSQVSLRSFVQCMGLGHLFNRTIILTRSAWQGVSCTGAICAMYTTSQVSPSAVQQTGGLLTARCQVYRGNMRNVHHFSCKPQGRLCSVWISPGMLGKMSALQGQLSK